MNLWPAIFAVLVLMLGVWVVGPWLVFRKLQQIEQERDQ